jgi:hypothetical protein
LDSFFDKNELFVSLFPPLDCFCADFLKGVFLTLVVDICLDLTGTSEFSFHLIVLFYEGVFWIDRTDFYELSFFSIKDTSLSSSKSGD